MMMKTDTNTQQSTFAKRHFWVRHMPICSVRIFSLFDIQIIQQKKQMINFPHISVEHYVIADVLN